MSFHLSEEILYLLIAAFVAGGSWFFWVLLKKIQRHCKSRRIQRGIANYCQQLSRE
jgi:hypothetical protein